MRASIVRIGNSQGIRIPKVVLEQTHLAGEVELEVQGSQIVIRQYQHPRHDWGKKFAEMAARGDDRLLDAESIQTTSWDKDEWTW